MTTETAQLPTTGPRERAGPRLRTGPAEDLAARIRLQLGFRLIIATALLIVTAMLHASGRSFPADYPFGAMYGCVFAFYLTALVAAIVWQNTTGLAGLRRIAVGQVAADLLATTALVHVTGGADSLFTFIYALQILNGSIVLLRRGVFIMAGAAAVVYGVLLALVSFGVVPPFHRDLGVDVSSAQLLFRITVASVGFILTGSLSSYLTEQLRQTREELREQSIDLNKLRALNQLVVDNISSGLLTVDHNGLVTSMNPFAQDVLGVSLEAVYQKPLSSLFMDQPDDRMGASTLSRDELTYRRPDGKQLVLGFSASPLRDGAGDLIGQIIVFRDLTDLRELEERVKRDERLAAVGRLAAGIAHEIRNPLASISGSVELLQGEIDTEEEAARLMEIVVRESDRLNGLISEFLNYVRPERIRRVRVEIADLLKETVEALQERPDFECSFDIEAQGETAVVGDPEKLKQVLYNLLLNAVDAMPGGGCVTVRLERQVRSSDPVVHMTVRDEGDGIPQEDQRRVFDPFFTTKSKGTGLGLAIAHKIIDAHRGYIEVESKPGKGAAFHVVLPAWTPDSVEAHFDATTR